MTGQKVINAESIKGAGILFLYLAIGFLFAYLSGVLCVKIHTPAVGITGLIVFIGLPLFTYIAFNKRISQYYTRRAKFIFYDNYFQLILSNYRTDLEESNNNYCYSDILSCTVSSAQRKRGYSRITLHFANNRTYNCNLRDIDESKSEKIPELIYHIIKQKQPGLFLNPPFLLSKSGKSGLIILGIALTILAIIHIFYARQSSPFTFMISISTFINLLAKQKSDKETYKRLLTN